jgi:hypothetical protein
MSFKNGLRGLFVALLITSTHELYSEDGNNALCIKSKGSTFGDHF